MYLAVMIYAAIALIYFIITSYIARKEAKKRKRRFPKYKRFYAIEYKQLAIEAIIFPVDMIKKIIGCI